MERPRGFEEVTSRWTCCSVSSRSGMAVAKGDSQKSHVANPLPPFLVEMLVCVLINVRSYNVVCACS